jgi:2'-5' RNA ligase
MRQLAPSEATALILRATLPPRLEALRRRCVPDAVDGLPAHVTVAYPFAEPGSIDEAVIGRIAEVVARHAPWTMRLVERRRWPDTVYVSVDPEAPAIALQADLAAAFPSLPIYGGTIEVFVPHVTVAEGPSVHDPAVDADPGWDDLPVTGAVSEVELIVRSGVGRWTVERRFPMRR